MTRKTKSKGIGSIIYVTRRSRVNYPDNPPVDLRRANSARLGACGTYSTAKSSIDDAIRDDGRRHILIIDARADGPKTPERLAKYAKDSSGDFYILGIYDRNDPFCASLDTRLFDAIIPSRDMRLARNHLIGAIPGFWPADTTDCRYDS